MTSVEFCFGLKREDLFEMLIRLPPAADIRRERNRADSRADGPRLENRDGG